MTISWKKTTSAMLRGIAAMLTDVLVLKPTGPTKVQAGITAVSVGYLGYVWWVESRCPFLPRSSSSWGDEQERRKRMKTRDDREQDEEEEKLQRELGFTTFAEWKERGFIPDSKKKIKPHPDEKANQSSSSSSCSSPPSSSV